jgi:hypothetical protein
MASLRRRFSIELGFGEPGGRGVPTRTGRPETLPPADYVSPRLKIEKFRSRKFACGGVFAVFVVLIAVR